MVKKCGISALVVIAVIAINYWLLDYVTNKKINCVEVYVASRDISPRQTIEDKDIETILIPAAYVMENVIRSKAEILGKITNLQGKIPKDSLFYKTQLENIEKIPDTAVPQLRLNQVAYVITNDGNSLDFSSFVVGQKVDVYVSIQLRNEKPIFDELLSSVRIISIKDRKGIEITSNESTGSPYSITVAIGHDQIIYLSQSSKMGNLEIYATSDSYGKGESQVKKDSKILNVLNVS